MSTKKDENTADSCPQVKSGIVRGWFGEHTESCAGHALYMQVRDVLYHEKSEYQDILVFNSETFGNVLVLDGVINCTEVDECSYQEMMTNIALCSHPDPQSVLIIGGGDGGIAREVARHNCVKRIVQCEIDGKVVEVCKRFLPSMARGLDDPRVEIIIGDGFEYLGQHRSEFDIVITDSSDPVGPAEALFKKEYYERLHSTLKSDGLLISQAGEPMWVKLAVDYIEALLIDLQDIFAVVNYAYTLVPTYTMGQLGLLMASKNPETRFEQPRRLLSECELDRMGLRYYNPDMHKASFVLPTFMNKWIPLKRRISEVPGTGN